MLQGKENLILFVCFPDEEGENHYPSAHCFAEKGLNLFQAGEPFYPRRLIDILVNGTFTTYSVHLVQLGTYNFDGKWNVWKILKSALNRCFSDKTSSFRFRSLPMNFEYFLCFPKTKSLQKTSEWSLTLLLKSRIIRCSSHIGLLEKDVLWKCSISYQQPSRVGDSTMFRIQNRNQDLYNGHTIIDV